MDELPLLPKTKPAWVACLILIIALFLFYYTYLYQPLLESYNLQNHVIRYTYKATESVTKGLEVDLVTPKYLGGDSVPSVTISVRNLKPETVDLKLRLSWEPQNLVDNHDLAIISLTGNIQPTEAHIQVQPYSYAFVQLPLIFMGNSLDLEHELFILATVDGAAVPERLSAETTAINSVVSRIDSALYFILKNLLLPPLANGLLPGLALMSCWFVEHDKEEEFTWGTVFNILIKAAVCAFAGISLFFGIVTNGTLIYQLLLIISLTIICVYILINAKGFWENRKLIFKNMRINKSQFSYLFSVIKNKINTYGKR